MKKEEEKNKKKTKKVDKTTKIEDIESVVDEVEVVEKDEINTGGSDIGDKVTKVGNNNDIFLVLGLIAVFVLGFLVMRDKDAGPSYELPLTLSGEAGLHELTYEEYQDKIDNNEEFVVILERASCSHCVSFLPVAEQFAIDNEVPMYYIDTDTFDYEDWDNFEKSISYLKKANGNWGTPTTVVQAGYETVDYIEGETNAKELTKLYNKYFDMKEE